MYEQEVEPTSGSSDSDYLRPPPSRKFRPVSFLMMNSPTTPSFSPFSPSTDTHSTKGDDAMVFHTQKDMLDYVTQNWRSDFVTTDLGSFDQLEIFKTRPFCMVLSVDAPILTRFQRSLRQACAVFSFHGINSPIICYRLQVLPDLSLEQFVQEHDSHFYGDRFADKATSTSLACLRQLHSLVDLHIINSFDTVHELHDHLEELDITSAERLRPSWDTYFMRLASLASLRSNCMKRRVGAILVRNKRIVSTG